MKFSKGKISNINRKLLAGSLALIMVGAPLTGCVSINDINYTTNESGYIQGIDGTVSYSFLSSCSFYQITNELTQERYYTIGLNDGLPNYNRYDIFTKQRIDNKEHLEYRFTGYVSDYLNAFNTIKDEYTEDDLKEILNKFIETQEKYNNKQLVKEK